MTTYHVCPHCGATIDAEWPTPCPLAPPPAAPQPAPVPDDCPPCDDRPLADGRLPHASRIAELIDLLLSADLDAARLRRLAEAAGVVAAWLEAVAAAKGGTR